MKPSTQGIRLLPNYTRKIAIIILVLLIGAGFALAAFSDFNQEGKEIAKLGIFIPFLLFALSKDKEEDELTLQLRLKSYTFAFIGGLTTVITYPIANWIIDGQFISDITANDVIIQMIVFYCLGYISNRPENL